MRLTQRAVKQVLTERFYAWRDAQEVAASDPEVDMSGEGPAYVPSDFVDEDVMEEEEEHEVIEAAENQDQQQELRLPEAAPEGKPETRSNA